MNEERPTSPRPKRPRLIKLAAIIYLLISMFGWLRFQQAIAGSAWLHALAIFPPYPYIALTGMAWGLAGLSAAITIFIGWRFAPQLALIVTGFIVATYWLDFVLFNQSPVQLNDILFELIVSLAGLLAIIILPRLPGPKRFFDEKSGN